MYYVDSMALPLPFFHTEWYLMDFDELSLHLLAARVVAQNSSLYSLRLVHQSPVKDFQGLVWWCLAQPAWCARFIPGYPLDHECLCLCPAANVCTWQRNSGKSAGRPGGLSGWSWSQKKASGIQESWKIAWKKKDSKRDRHWKVS